MTEDGPGPAADPERDDRDSDEASGRDPRAGLSDDVEEQQPDAGDEERVEEDESVSSDAEERRAGRRNRDPRRTGRGSERESSEGGPTGEGGEGRVRRPGVGVQESGGAGDRPSTTADAGTDEVASVSGAPAAVAAGTADDVPDDVRTYDRFKKVDRASYDRVNEFLRDRTYITAREWAIARLCADFRTATGVEMTKIGENLPHLVPFMTDTYSPQAVNQARSAFERKVRMAGATFLYGAMSGFFTADELDELMYEVTEVAKFLLEVEGVELAVEEELDAEDRISAVMREVRQASEELRFEEVACPHCGQAYRPDVED